MGESPGITPAAANRHGAGAAALLEAVGVESGHGRLQALWGIDVSVPAGECVIVLGANGAGKSTLLRVVLGLLPLWAGQVRFEGQDISGLRTDLRVARGIAFMTETGVFAELTVQENLLLGAYRLGRRQARANLKRAYEAFPVVAEHRGRPAGSLSGGQRKLVGIAKVLMGEPRLIVMDEPSSGLSPLAVREVLGSLHAVRERDAALLIAEQNVAFLELADQTVVLEGGRMRFAGSVEQLRADDALHQAFFGLEGS